MSYAVLVHVRIHLSTLFSPGQNINTKKNIRQFSGFPADQAESLKEKRGEILNKQILSQLKTLADHLDIEVTGTKVRGLLRLSRF